MMNLKQISLAVLTGLSVVFSGCKKDDEEKQLPVGSLTNANFYGSWVSTDVPGTTQYMDFVEHNMWVSNDSNLINVRTITSGDTSNTQMYFEIDGGYLHTRGVYNSTWYKNKIYECSGNRFVIESSNTGSGRREYRRTTSVFNTPAHLDLSALKFFGSNSSGASYWLQFKQQTLPVTSSKSSVVLAYEQNGRLIQVISEELTNNTNKIYVVDNGVSTQLTATVTATGSLYYIPKSIVIIGNDVYIPTYISETTTYNSYNHNGYWKNGTWTTLNPPVVDVGGTPVKSKLQITGGCTDGTSLYMSANYEAAIYKKVCYWKDTTRIDLPILAGENVAATWDITYAGNSLIVCGSYGTSVACYWRDGVATSMNYTGELRKATIVNGKIVTAGYKVQPTGLREIFTVDDQSIDLGGSTASDNIVSLFYYKNHYFINTNYITTTDQTYWFHTYSFSILSEDLKNFTGYKIPFNTGNDKSLVNAVIEP